MEEEEGVNVLMLMEEEVKDGGVKVEEEEE